MDSWTLAQQAVGWLIFAVICIAILAVVLVAILAIIAVVRHTVDPKPRGQKAANIQTRPVPREAGSRPRPIE